MIPVVETRRAVRLKPRAVTAGRRRRSRGARLTVVEIRNRPAVHGARCWQLAHARVRWLAVGAQRGQGRLRHPGRGDITGGAGRLIIT